jgi:osmotically-inducible protein OsmY
MEPIVKIERTNKTTPNRLLSTGGMFFFAIAGSLFCLLLLSACVDAALTGANLVYHHNRFTHYAENGFIGVEGQRRINAEPRLANQHISVTGFESTALLLGQARTPQQKKLAAELISDIPGVERVVNRISIGPPIDRGQILEDTWLSTKVKTQMMLYADFDPDDIKITTENGVVYLIGTLREEYAKQAIEIAQETEGVTRVVTLFTYLYTAHR